MESRASPKAKTDENSSDYWDKYYLADQGEFSAPIIPSQFAAFCALECAILKIKNIVEIACGNGRDSLFFSQYGFNVLAVDQSKVAVQLLKKKANSLGNLDILRGDAVNDQLPMKSTEKSTICYYARFFIHALTEPQLTVFFSNLSKTMKIGDYFFTEYRNEKDKDKTKGTGEHLRTFFSADFIRRIAGEYQLECMYDISAEKGLAKYNLDDACVTRQIFIKRGKNDIF